MHDIKYIRNNPSEFEKEIKKRNVKIDLNKEVINNYEHRILANSNSCNFSRSFIW